MKALVCEMCNSQDLVKQDGVYVCQNCGTKYSVEEARKLMVEGTVKVDNSDKLANLYQVARRARDNNDSEGAAKYYDLIQIENPTDWEASFYSTYYKAMSCKIGEIRSAAISVSNCLDTVMQLLHDHVTDKGGQDKAIREISSRCSDICWILGNAASAHHREIDLEIEKKYREETAGRIVAAEQILFRCGDAIASVFGDDPELAALAAKPWKNGIERVEGNKSTKWLPSCQSDIVTYTQKIKQIDKSGYAAIRIPQLKTEIAQQEQILAKTPKKANFSKVALIVGGLFVLLALAPFFIGVDFKNWLEETEFLILGVLGLGVLFLGRPTKAKGQRFTATREAAQKRLEEARKELAELEK